MSEPRDQASAILEEDMASKKQKSEKAIKGSVSKKAEERLRESEGQASRTLVEQMVAGVYECDATGRFTLANQRYCEIVGYTEAELMKMRVEDVTSPDNWPHNAELYRRLYEYGESFFIEKCYQRKDASEIW